MTHLIDSSTIVAQALGWAIVHSIWQITILYLFFKAIAWVFHRHNNVAYVSALLTMSVAAVWSAATFIQEYRIIKSEAVSESIQINTPTAAAITTTAPVESAPLLASAEILPEDLFFQWLEEHSALLGWAWLLIVLILSVRLSGGYWLAWRLRRKGVTAPDAEFSEMCSHWAERLGIQRHVQLLESKYITEPLTLGFWKPVVLFPAGMLLQLSPEQVEALLLHELAHIRRHDYLVNLIQLTLDTIFFYHPLFWLISGEARRRREYRCDDTVLRYTRHPLEYARTLTEIQLYPVHTLNPFTMNLSGKDQFTVRIMRIAGIHPQRSNRSSLLLLMLLLMGTVTMLCLPATTKAAESGDNTPLQTVTELLGSIASQTENAAAPKPAFKQQKPRPEQKNEENTVIQNEKIHSPTPDSVAPASAVTIELSKMNVCYVGIDNPMQIAVDGVPAKELSVRMNVSGEICWKNGQYTARFYKPGPAQISIYRVQNGKETLLASKTYRIKRIPDPTPLLCGMESGQVAIEDLIACKELTLLLENFDYDAVFEVVGYEVTVWLHGSDPISINATGSTIPLNAQELIKNLTPGSAVFFDDIKVKGPGDETPRNIGSLSFKVK